jgi:integrase
VTILRSTRRQSAGSTAFEARLGSFEACSSAGAMNRCATAPVTIATKHQLRHAHAVEMAREGVALIVIQRQLGHTNLGITSIYLQGIDSTEIIDTVHGRRAQMIPVTAR